MKKKLFSFIAAIIVCLISVFASGCGDKFKGMEFEVLYAYSENATEWYDGTNGISLNYNPNDVYNGGERTSLIFENGSQAAFASFQTNLQNTYQSAIQVYSGVYNNLPCIYFEKAFFDETGTDPATSPLQIGISWETIYFDYDPTITNDQYYVFVQRNS